MQSVNNVDKNKRVGIVSLFGLYNFGNRLQGYALDRILRDLGFEPETVVLYRKLGISVALAGIRSRIVKQKGTRQSIKRMERFREFIAEQSIRYIYLPTQISFLAKQYDYFCVGSDQVWNPRADLFSHTKLLKFAAPEQRVAVAPSFGVNSLPGGMLDEYESVLRCYKALSVREEDGAKIIEELVGVRPMVIVDPTLALTAEQWRVKADQGTVPGRPYILIYFLGGWSGEVTDYINLDSVSASMKVVDLLDASSDYYGSGPQDFLGLIDEASLVLTDSFHASVFSTIFGTPFRVYRRNEVSSTYSRIESLISTYELDDVEGFGPVPLPAEERRTRIVSLLEVKRLEFVNYLKEALDA